jgi:hypothetical protein
MTDPVIPTFVLGVETVLALHDVIGSKVDFQEDIRIWINAIIQVFAAEATFLDLSKDQKVEPCEGEECSEKNGWRHGRWLSVVDVLASECFYNFS